MIAALTCPVICWQPSEHKLMEENKSLILDGAKLVNKSKQAPHCTVTARHEIVAPSITVHLLSLAIQLESNVSSWVQQELNEIQLFSDHNCRLWDGIAGILLSQGARKDDSTMVALFPALSKTV